MMSTTIPHVFEGTPSIDALKLDRMMQWYKSALGDMDKASDMDDALYYWGGSDMGESMLRLLYAEPETTVAVTIAKKSHPKLKTLALIAVGVTVYVVWKKRDVIREKLNQL
jgi:hypothetical protein